MNSVDVDLNTGLVTIKLTPGGGASMHQFNKAVEKNDFTHTHKDANIVARGNVTGTTAAPFLEVAGARDHFALKSTGATTDLAALLGKV